MRSGTASLLRPVKRRLANHSLLAWIIWAVTALFVLFQFSLQLSTGVMVDGLEHSFQVHAFEASLIASAYYYIYVALQTPAGFLMDRFGPRRLLTIGGMVCTIGCFCFAHSHSPWLAGLSRVLMGAGASFAFVGSLYIIGKWFPEERFGMIVGIAETMGMFGAILGNLYLAKVIHTYGWRHCMTAAGLIALLLALLCWTVVRDKPRRHRWKERHQAKFTFQESIKIILKQPIAWLNGLYSGLMFTTATVFITLWGLPFISHTYHLTTLMAILVSSTLFAGICIGGPIAGYIAGLMVDRRPVLIGAALILIIIMLLIIYLPPVSLALLITLLFLAGFVSSSYVISFTIANEIAPCGTKSTSIGLANSLDVLPAPILQPLIGYILDWSAKHHSAAGHLIYTTHDYQVALLILPLSFAVAAIMACFIKP